jgi:DNA-directed RNA polymerase subunit M/transcription elongation factor TFIIS
MDMMTCLRCGHRWETRKKTGLPAQCPHCKSPYWNTPRQYQRVMREAVKAAPAGVASVAIHTGQGTKVAEQEALYLRRNRVESLYDRQVLGSPKGCSECGSLSGHQRGCSKA